VVASKKKRVKIVETPNYIVEDLPNPPKSKVKGYRRVRAKKQKGHLITVALLKGGGSVATSIWHPKSERKASNPAVEKALARARKKKKEGKQNGKKKAGRKAR